MTDLEKAARQALEALESYTPGDYSTGHVIYPSCDEDAVIKAITALTAALEQPEVWVTPKLRPLANLAHKQKPVEWDGRCVLGHCGSPSGCADSDRCRADTRPQAREPLTDEQIVAKALHLSGLGTRPDVIQFARAIEAAHGITGEKK